MRRKTKQLALCGVLSALAVALMLLGTMLPLATFCCPLLASLVLLVAVRECGGAMAACVWAVTAVLSLLLAPDKEAAALFAFMGYYPVLKPVLEKIRVKVLQIVAKLGVFNIAIGLMYALLLWVFRLDSLTAEMQGYTQIMTICLLLLGNVTFLLYDFVLSKLTLLYCNKLQKTIRKIF